MSVQGWARARAERDEGARQRSDPWFDEGPSHRQAPHEALGPKRPRFRDRFPGSTCSQTFHRSTPRTRPSRRYPAPAHHSSTGVAPKSCEVIVCAVGSAVAAAGGRVSKKCFFTAEKSSARMLPLPSTSCSGS